MSTLLKDLAQPGEGKASVAQLARCIFWGFFGVRKAEDLDHDAANISPVQVIVAALVGVVVFHVAVWVELASLSARNI